MPQEVTPNNDSMAQDGAPPGSETQSDSGEINGSFDDSPEGEGEPLALEESPIKSSADIRAAARGEKLAAQTRQAEAEVTKQENSELPLEELDETVEDQIKAGKIKGKLQEAEVETQQDNNQQQPPKQGGRDYTGIDTNDQWMFKKMPNKEYEIHKKNYIEIKRLRNDLVEAKKPKSTDLPTNYFEHPEAFALSPTYKKITSNLGNAQAIADHWADQQINIQMHGKFVPLIEKDGKYIYGEEQEASEDDRKFVNRAEKFAQNQVMKHQANHDKFVGDFKQSHEDALQVIKGAEEEFFKDYDKEDHPTRTLQNQIKEKIPAAFQNSPLLPLLVKTGAANALLVAENQRLQKELNIAKGIKQDKAKAQPNGKTFVPGSSAGNRTSRITSSADIRRAAMEG